MMLNGAKSAGLYKILLSKDAHKYYERLPIHQALRIDIALSRLSNDPYRGGDIKRLLGISRLYRLRVGDLRLIFEVHEKEKAIWIDQILPRGQAYK